VRGAVRQTQSREINMPLINREEVELGIKATITEYQFDALKQKIDMHKIVTELQNLKYLRKIQRRSDFRISKLKNWVINGWNTEHILRLNQEYLSKSTQSYALQWAFPQAYYSCFSIIVGFLYTIGSGETSHRDVIQKVGLMMNNNNYPETLSFLSSGTKNNMQFINIDIHNNDGKVLNYDSTDSKSVDTQIGRFLKSTREVNLDIKKKEVDIPLKNPTKERKYKIRYEENDWKYVSKKLGYTNLLSLLYRKRIKSNYRDIDTFLTDKIDAGKIVIDLIHIVSSLNFTYEAYLYKALGKNKYSSLINDRKVEDKDFLQKRFKVIKNRIMN
jgi:hypothetical protein